LLLALGGNYETKELRRDLRKKARRWPVERTHRWINRFRRLLIRWEKLTDNFLAMLHTSPLL
jgi:putative transposase